MTNMLPASMQRQWASDIGPLKADSSDAMQDYWRMASELNESRPGSGAWVPLGALDMAPELWPRDRINEDAVERYAENFDAMDPIVVDQATYKVLDGHHRVRASIKAIRDHIRVLFVEVPPEQLRDFAWEQNRNHGVPYTMAEQKKYARSAWKTHHPDHPDKQQRWTYAEFARRTGLREATFSRWHKDEQADRQASNQDGGNVTGLRATAKAGLLNSTSTKDPTIVGPSRTNSFGTSENRDGGAPASVSGSSLPREPRDPPEQTVRGVAVRRDKVVLPPVEAGQQVPGTEAASDSVHGAQCRADEYWRVGQDERGHFDGTIWAVDQVSGVKRIIAEGVLTESSALTIVQAVTLNATLISTLERAFELLELVDAVLSPVQRQQVTDLNHCFQHATARSAPDPYLTD
jgi:hypothetical protein